MIKLTDILREIQESEIIPVRYENDTVASYSGQSNHELAMYRVDGEGPGDGILGVVEYVIFQGEMTVSMITVVPKYRRLGIGSRLIQKMIEENPDAKYKPSLATDLGAEFKHKTYSDSEMNYIKQ